MFSEEKSPPQEFAKASQLPQLLERQLVDIPEATKSMVDLEMRPLAVTMRAAEAKWVDLHKR